MTQMRRVQLPAEKHTRSMKNPYLIDRVRMDNEDAVNVVAFSPGRRGAWTVVRHKTFEAPVRQAVAWLLKLNAQLKGRCSWQVWYRIIGFIVETEPTHPIMASGSGVGIQMWRGSNQIATLRGHVSIVRTLTFAQPTGEVLASGSYDNTIKIWRQRSKARDYANRRKTSAFAGHTKSNEEDDEAEHGFVWQGRPAPKVIPKRRMSQGGENDDDWICTATLLGHSREVLAVAIAPTTTYITATRNSSIIRRNQSAQSLASSADGHNEMHRDLLLVSSSWDGSCRVWSVDAAERGESAFLYSISSSSGAVRSVAFSPDGNVFASGSDDAVVRIRAPRYSSAVMSNLDSKPYGEQEFDHEDESESTSCGGVIELRGHTSWVYSVAFSPMRSDILASGSQDCTVRIWTKNHDDEYLPSIWTASDCIVNHQGWVYSVAFSYNGELLASAAADGHVKLNKISVYSDTDHSNHASGELSVEAVDEIREAHDGVVYTVAFPASSRYQSCNRNMFFQSETNKNIDNADENRPIGFASGSVDGTIGLWSVDPCS